MEATRVPRQARGHAFGALIRSARARADVTQDDVARRAGVSRDALSRWERGNAQIPHPRHVRSVCAVLDIDPVAALIALGYLEESDVPAAVA
jgi:transcriptional regulator with XRE-family HTH domain